MSNKREPLFAEHESLESKVYQAIGAGSMCWTDTPTGVFDSDRAKYIGDEIWMEIQADRAKDSELIQQLFDALTRLSKSVKRAPFDTLVERDLAIAAAEAAGFKPSGR